MVNAHGRKDYPHARQQCRACWQGRVACQTVAGSIAEIWPNSGKLRLLAVFRVGEIPADAIDDRRAPSAFCRAKDADAGKEIVLRVEAGHDSQGAS